MSTTTRIEREPPRRSGPIRNVSLAFRAPERPAGAPPAAAPPGVVERAVDTAYRVFEDYMRRGREAAERRPEPADNGGPMKNGRQDQAAAAMRYWAEMAQTWFGAMAPWMMGAVPAGGMPAPWAGPPGPWGPPPMWAMPAMWGMPRPERSERSWDMGGRDDGPPPAPWDAPEPRRAPPATPQRLALGVEIASALQAEVTVMLHDASSTRYLAAPELHPTPGDGRPPLTAVRLDHAGDHLRVRVVVPPEQPPGVYAGPILDRDDRAVGTLQVALRHRS